MNEVQMEKCAWVNGYLSATLREADLDVWRLRYRISGAQEFVDVLFSNNYVKQVCVTGDSKKAIIADVLKVV